MIWIIPITCITMVIGPPMMQRPSHHLEYLVFSGSTDITAATSTEQMLQIINATVSHIGIICLLLESYYQIRIKSVESQSRIFPISNDYDRIQ